MAKTKTLHEQHLERLAATKPPMVASASAWAEEQKRERASVKVLPRGQRPRCAYCGNELRLFKFRGAKGREGKVYGDYGEGLFCGLRCGYGYGVAVCREVRRK